mmetsp:Transcript_106100/g.306972  ORF Transcript_106100/g.306972 Transcript_106100/m.306972 type:complete len:1464 (+) Transcript_106100:116-4507(+)|eukprot:CAMPEP_0119466462 /NCGR_PEP_ID=MMETSP1344-20130328/1106_1 /TAXON_ID=236787 /ORGANISM="Florenciella parvula, Strain CCMP2471" /LENGTH=1463 /DNA_ID=CAMNT_0007498781 /DNA_START=106 /DNA_END=4497 /DNA_ORIENTATION=-
MKQSFGVAGLALALLACRFQAAAFTVGGSGYAPFFAGYKDSNSLYSAIVSDPRVVNGTRPGVPEWIECDAGQNDADCVFSLTFWYKSNGQGGEATPFTYLKADDDDVFFNLFLPGTVIIAELGTEVDTGTYALDANVDVFNDDWHHIAITWSPSAFNMYVDGDLTTATASGPLNNAIGPGGMIIIGQEPDGYCHSLDCTGLEFDAGQAFNGHLDELRVFKKELTVDEINTDLAQAYTDTYAAATDLILALPFDDPYYTDAEGYLRVKAYGTGGFPDLFAGNPTYGMAANTVPVLGPSLVSSQSMGADVVTAVEPAVGKTQSVVLMADSSATSFTIDSLPACCNVTDTGTGNTLAAGDAVDITNHELLLTVHTAAAVDGDSFAYSASDGSESGTANVVLMAASAPHQLQANCAEDVNLGETDPPHQFTLYGFSEAGIGTSVEFVSIPENGKLYQATAVREGSNVELEVDYSAEITAGSISTVPGGRFYFVVEEDKAMTGTVDDYAVFTYYLVDNLSGMKSAQIGTRTINVMFAEDLPEVPGLGGETVTTTEDSAKLIIDLSGSVDPEGSATLPVVTSLPTYGKLYQVDADGTTMGDEITGFFSPWEVRQPFSQWVSVVSQSADNVVDGHTLTLGTSYGDGTAASAWGALDVLGPPENCGNSEEGTLCYASCASTTYAPSQKNGLLSSAASCVDEYDSDGTPGADGYCDEYIDLGFETPVRPTKVEVFDASGGGSTVAVEVLNPITGSFDKLWAGDEFVKGPYLDITNGLLEKPFVKCNEGDCHPDGYRCLICNETQGTCEIPDVETFESELAVLEPTLCQRDYLTRVIRLRLNSHDLDSWNCIDAVRLTGEVDLKTGFVSNTDGKIIYVPAADYGGMDSFSYTATDCLGVSFPDSSDYAHVNITVNEVNDKPTSDPSKIVDADFTGYETVGKTLVTIDAYDVDLPYVSDEVLTTRIEAIPAGLTLYHFDSAASSFAETISTQLKTGEPLAKCSDVANQDVVLKCENVTGVVDTAGSFYVEPQCDNGQIEKTYDIEYTVTDTAGLSVSAVQTIEVKCGCRLHEICENGAKWADGNGKCFADDNGAPKCGDRNGKCPDGFAGGACQVNTTLRNSLFFIGLVFLLVQIGSFFLLLKWVDTPVFKAASPTLSVISAGGVVLATAAVLTMVTYSDNENDGPFQATCVATPLLVDFGFVFVAVPMFARVYRISKVFNNKKLRTIAVRESDMVRLCVPFWVLWALYHAVWMIFDTPIIQLHEGPGENGQYITWYECQSVKSSFDWQSPILVACTCILLYGAVLCWEIRKVPSKFNESKFVAFVIYTTVVLGVIGMLALVVLPVTDIDNRLMIQAVGCIVLPMAYNSGLVIPKFLEVLKPNSVITPSGGSTTGGFSDTGGTLVTMDSRNTAGVLQTEDAGLRMSQMNDDDESAEAALAAKEVIIQELRQRVVALSQASHSARLAAQKGEGDE